MTSVAAKVFSGYEKPKNASRCPKSKAVIAYGLDWLNYSGKDEKDENASNFRMSWMSPQINPMP